MKQTRRATTIDKGRVVEKIVALLHEQPGISVKRNVMLPTSDGQDKREIDVLITGQLVGYPVQLAIECKNYGRRIGKGDIDAFVGKLKDLGFPMQYGIYVSTSQYTGGAVKRAKNAGVRALNLDGLTKDRLSESLYDALQSIVYLLPIVTSLSFFNAAPEMSPQEMAMYFNECGERLFFFDLLWRNWCDGKYPMKIGSHNFEVEIPAGYTQYCKGKRLDSAHVTLILQVIAVVVQISGKAYDIQLTNYAEQTVARKNIRVSFDGDDDSSLAVSTFESEEGLDAFLQSIPQNYRLVLGRLPLPRILTPGRVLWPPSQKYMDNINRLAQEHGGNIELQNVDMLSLHGDNLVEALFDNIWEGHTTLLKTGKLSAMSDDTKQKET